MLNGMRRLGYEMFKLAGIDVNVSLLYKFILFYSTIGNYHRRDGTGEEELTALLESAKWS